MPSSTTTTARRMRISPLGGIFAVQLLPQREQGCSTRTQAAAISTAPMPPPPLSLARIVLLAVAAEGLLTLMDAIIKALSARYPTLQIAFLRFGFGLIGAAIYTAWNRPGWPTREATLYNGMRALLIVVIATTFFFALARLPLADAIALSFISPVLTALFGVHAAGRAPRLADCRGARRRLCRHAADRRRRPRQRRHERRRADRRRGGADLRGRICVQHRPAAPPGNARSAVADRAVPEPRTGRHPGAARAVGVDGADAVRLCACSRCSARWA